MKTEQRIEELENTVNILRRALELYESTDAMCSNGDVIPKMRELMVEKEILLSAVQMAYQKHHLGMAAIGWEQLSDKLHNVLCEVMGDDAYIAWSSSFEDAERSML